MSDNPQSSKPFIPIWEFPSQFKFSSIVQFEVHTHLAHARDKSKVKNKPERERTGTLSQAMLAQGRAIIVGLSGSSIEAYVVSRSGQKGVLGELP
ncbi:hypothetical protein [Planctobacterium marinum]|uniref:hypothetical protein n=1 Tax=Planctobacterium marinum TaxID=1631968 RepID=UPI0030C65A84